MKVSTGITGGGALEPIVLFKKSRNRIVPDAGDDVPSVKDVPRNSVNPCGNDLSAANDKAVKLIGYPDSIHYCEKI